MHLKENTSSGRCDTLLPDVTKIILRFSRRIVLHVIAICAKTSILKEKIKELSECQFHAFLDAKKRAYGAFFIHVSLNLCKEVILF